MKDLECKLPLLDRDTFKAANTDAKLMILFDLQCTSLENQSKIEDYLVKRKRVDTVVASIFGAVAGFIGGLFDKAV